jgi:hypothetical protein
VNYPAPVLRASHINARTAIPPEDLPSDEDRGRPIVRHPKLVVEVGSDTVTPYGGLVLPAGLVKQLRIARELDERLHLLKVHRPYHESDHVLAQVYNLFVGGQCLEDVANLQISEAVRRMLGADRLPDPTTAGDFLRRFGEDDLRAFDAVQDVVQERAWRKIHKGSRRLALVDLDSHVRPVYGAQKEGADFSYKGSWAYHPLLVTLAGTNEVLRLINRPGNVVSEAGAADALTDLFPLLNRNFQRVVVRGDSAFYDHAIMDACVAAGQFFALVVPSMKNVVALADALPPEDWRPFLTKAQRAERARPTPEGKSRARRENLRRKTARRRKKKDLRLQEQWIAEIPYTPTRSAIAFRLLIRAQRIEVSDTQGELFDQWRYRFAITNLPAREYSAEDAMDLTYDRCDQENVIEQLGNGVAGMRMPTGDLLANAAFLCCARLAHNLKSWLGQLVLPAETARWEWRRFRQAFVYIAAEVVHHARQVIVRFSGIGRFGQEFLIALRKLQT